MSIFDTPIAEQIKEECMQLLQNSENKTEAIMQVIEKLNETQYEKIINQITEEAARAAHDEEFRKSLNLRTLSKEEESFYEYVTKFSPKQASNFTGKQPDIFPTSIIDATLNNVKKRSRIGELITFAPADVKKWLIAEKTGTYAWGKLDATLESALTANIKAINFELGKLYVIMVIPKAIRELSLPFVDRYFMAIIEEALYDGMSYGYINGNGVDQPIGIFYKVSAVESGGSATAKDVISTITGFSPKQLSPVKKTLSNGGLRTIQKLYLVCNPEDMYEYVEPALYGQNADGTYTQRSNTLIDLIPDANCPKGKAAFTLAGHYTMGFHGIRIDEYKETKALDDADLLIGKTYANGRATDDNTAVVFDVTKLIPFVPSVQAINEEIVAKLAEIVSKLSPAAASASLKMMNPSDVTNNELENNADGDKEDGRKKSK